MFPASETSADLDTRVRALMVRDRRRLERRLARARSQRGEEGRQAAVDEVETDVHGAEARLARRRRALPAVRYPAGLPVSERRDDLVAAIVAHQVVIVAGETGSGKSTQLPKMCLEAGVGVRGMIGHTQPRRLAARTVAERVAEELGTGVGGAVGYTVRFTDRVGDGTFVKVMTDGILLAEIQRDRDLDAYEAIIVDEAHERSLNIDFILGYLKQLLPRRPDLKVIVTSATIDTERLSRHFDDAPVVSVTGRAYPVEVRYQPIGDERDDDRDQAQAICEAVDELCAEGPGDILVFLSGEREIRDSADALARNGPDGIETVPLYARLSIAEQHKVFQPHRGRRVVLATNVAETSLTVPGIRYVIDPGTARISRYNRRTKVQRLPIEAVSQASANQRAGRCGRVAPGICIRLYAEDDFDARPEFTEPEILRTSLAAVILQMTALGLGDVAAFPFVDAPDTRNINDGIVLLTELGALEPAAGTGPLRLTETGRRLARLPLDPRLGRMVLESGRNGSAREVLVIAAALAIQDPRQRPAGQEAAAAEAHARFADPTSDFLGYLRLWEHLQEEQPARSSSQFRRLCRDEFLNYLRVREWQDVHSQLRHIARSVGVEEADVPAPPDQVHRAVLSGLLSNIGVRDDDKSDFAGARNARFVLAPGSALHRKPPRWVMAAELVETNRLRARVAARIQPAWAERVGGHLVRRSHGEPWWDAERGAAMASETVTLHGLTIAQRTVNYGRIDPGAARELFVQRGLVEGDWHTHHAFLRHNAKLVEEVQALEGRVRRRDILVGDEVIFDFYDRRVPSTVVSARHFDRWWTKRREAGADLLDFTYEMLVDPAAGPVRFSAYPARWDQGELSLALSYEFEPGSDFDGVTVEVPVAVLNRVSPEGFDWQVPGLREELVTAFVRSLPKQVRRNFVPVADSARRFVEGSGPDDGPLLATLARELSRLSGEAIDPSTWPLDRVPAYLHMTFRVVDASGRTLAAGKDLDALKRALAPRVRAAVADAAPGIERTGLTSWSIGTLPRVAETERDGHTVRGYPALVDETGTVAVRILPSAGEQAAAMWAGSRRLLLLSVPVPAGKLQRLFGNETRLALAYAAHATVAELLDDCTTCAVDRFLADAGGPVWDADAFGALVAAARSGLVPGVTDVATTVAAALLTVRDIEVRTGRLTAPALQPAVADVRAQMARLLGPGWVTATGARRLPDVLRYLRAIDRRLDKLAAAPERDRQLMAQAQQLEQRYDRLRARPARTELLAALDGLRWLLEELRVSYFAQVLGTAERVSEKRILNEIARLER
ncbi:MAG: ATP-dependent RNA helicase HrpA [Acidimicrobiia bacterium]